MSVTSLLGDAETLLIAAKEANDRGQSRAVGLAAEARTSVDAYVFERQQGQPEPWVGADRLASDIEAHAGLIEEAWDRRRRKVKVKRKPSIADLDMFSKKSIAEQWAELERLSQ